MKIRHDDHDRTSIITLSGDFTAEHVDPFRRVIIECTQGGIRDLVFIMNEVPLVDSAALEALLWAQEQVAEALGQVRLVQPDENVVTILRLTRLAQHFDCHQDVTDAVRSLR